MQIGSMSSARLASHALSAAAPVPAVRQGNDAVQWAKEMGPGIAAEPHCAELGFAGLRFVPRLRPEGKASAIRDPCSPAQASRRFRWAARFPGLLPRISAPDRLAAHPRPLPALPSPPGSPGSGPRTLTRSPFRFGGSGPRLRLISTASLRKRLLQASVQSVTCFSSRFWQASSDPIGHHIVRSRPFLG